VSIPKTTLRRTIACLLVLLFSATLLAGCSSGATRVTTTSLSVGTSSTATTMQGSTTTTAPLTLSEFDKELAKTATVQHQLAVFLTDSGADQDDPRMGIFYGLKARVQALSCRKALDGGDLEMADSAMQDVYYSLNLGTDIATGTVAQTLAGARAIVATLGKPSDEPDNATVLLDQFIAALAALLDEATAMIPATTST